MTLPPATMSSADTHRNVVAAIFAERPQAERAIEALQAAGFAGDQIGVAMRDRTDTGALVDDTGATAMEGALGGAVGGGLLGGVAGLVLGMIAALALPGIGPVVAGGTLAAALGVAGGSAVAGAGLGAAAGGVVGALNQLGVPETEAEHFERGFRAGGVLLTVNAGPRAAEALTMLAQHGGDLGPTVVLQDSERPTPPVTAPF